MGYLSKEKKIAAIRILIAGTLSKKGFYCAFDRQGFNVNSQI